FEVIHGRLQKKSTLCRFQKKVFYLGHFCNCKFMKEDFLRSLLYRRHLWKSSFVNIGLLLKLIFYQNSQRRGYF
ncbi:unnamed protein product, partial [Brassica rapa]